MRGELSDERFPAEPSEDIAGRRRALINTYFTFRDVTRTAVNFTRVIAEGETHRDELQRFTQLEAKLLV